jgi:hypothetical protein
LIRELFMRLDWLSIQLYRSAPWTGPIPTASAPARAPFDPATTALARKHASFERLEAEITELWGHLNAATYRFLILLAEFDRSKAFERHGAREHGAMAELAVRHR